MELSRESARYTARLVRRVASTGRVSPERSWTEGWRRTDIGAANGHGNARSLARLQSAVACGGEFDGIRLLSPQTIDRIFEVQSKGINLAIGAPSKWCVGDSLAPEGRVFL